MAEWNPDQKVLEEIIAELNNSPNNVELSIGNVTYSREALIEQIKEGTPIGKEFYNLHLELKDRLSKRDGWRSSNHGLL